ncbi:hypothetical protein Q3V37_06335 [Micromonospora profundi]|uniref:Uncharacterized protein n=1 Tax=Micromonospora profundi TaxID=1420889 RepID=A0AAJ6HZ07_9ACTN|nr:hypothetical protein [Micromonospora profundi]WLS48972.1 hypothetical protein Q3V37_06335 [Micromonospora profundi]
MAGPAKKLAEQTEDRLEQLADTVRAKFDKVTEGSFRDRIVEGRFADHGDRADEADHGERTDNGGRADSGDRVRPESGRTQD